MGVLWLRAANASRCTPSVPQRGDATVQSKGLLMDGFKSQVKCLVCGKSFEVANECDWQEWSWSGLSNLPQHACNLSARSDVSVTDQHVENNGTVDVEVSETE